MDNLVKKATMGGSEVVETKKILKLNGKTDREYGGQWNQWRVH